MALHLSGDLTELLVTTVFSFLIGLELKTYRQQFHPEGGRLFFGTARTYTFIGILGFVFYRIDLAVYVAVLLALSGLYAILYSRKVGEGGSSILPYTVMLLVYSFGPVTQHFPFWMAALLFVLSVFLLNARDALSNVSRSIKLREFEILGKMVLLSAVILPLLPDTQEIPYLPISPFKLWLAVVVISGISYAGYLVQKYLFPRRGYFLTGIIGGTYSSTATTVVLARKVYGGGGMPVVTAAIIGATSMMYLRLVIVALVFNPTIARDLVLPFVLLSGVGLLISLFYLRAPEAKTRGDAFVDKNPLELGTAFLFALLFAVMMLLTNYVMTHYGEGGLRLLSFAVGFTDIDPFVLSILTGKYTVPEAQLVSAVMIAAGSNNILKALYALWFGGWRAGRTSALWIGLLGVVTIVLGVWDSLGFMLEYYRTN